MPKAHEFTRGLAYSGLIQHPELEIEIGGKGDPQQIGNQEQRRSSIDPGECPDHDENRPPQEADDGQRPSDFAHPEKDSRPTDIQGKMDDKAADCYPCFPRFVDRSPPDKPESDAHEGEQCNPHGTEHPVRWREFRSRQGIVPAVEPLGRENRAGSTDDLDKQNRDEQCATWPVMRQLSKGRRRWNHSG